MVLFGFLNLSETSITRRGSIISMIQIALDVRRNQSKAKYEKKEIPCKESKEVLLIPLGILGNLNAYT